MRDKAFEITGTTKDEFISYCKDNGLPTYKVASKQKFFKEILDGTLCRNAASGQLIKKKKRNKK